MRCWVTLQKNRFRVSAIVAVSERVTENVGYQNEEFGNAIAGLEDIAHEH